MPFNGLTSGIFEAPSIILKKVGKRRSLFEWKILSIIASENEVFQCYITGWPESNVDKMLTLSYKSSMLFLWVSAIVGSLCVCGIWAHVFNDLSTISVKIVPQVQKLSPQR